MDAKGTGTFDESYQLVNLIGTLIGGYTHDAVKVALTANLGDILARECRTADHAEQQVTALAHYMADRIGRSLSGQTPAFSDAMPGVH